MSQIYRLTSHLWLLGLIMGSSKMTSHNFVHVLISSLHVVTLFSILWPLKPGVSNTWPAKSVGAARDSLLNDKIINFDQWKTKNDQIWPNFVLNTAYFSHSGPQSPSYSEMRPAETLSIQIWPINGFEFETPALSDDVIYRQPMKILIGTFLIIKLKYN